MSKIAWQFVVSRARCIFSVGNLTSSREPLEFSIQTVVNFTGHIPPSWREVSFGGIVMPWTWNSVFGRFASVVKLAEVSDPTVLVFREEVVARLADTKGNRVFAWAGDFHLFLVLLIHFTIKSIGKLIGQDVAILFICSRSWIFVPDCLHEGPRYKHFASALTKTEALLDILFEVVSEIVGICRRST